MQRSKVSRRWFVRGSIRLAAVAPLIQLTPIDAFAQADQFDAAERRTLDAAADVIIPADGRMPAATTVGAVRYIARIAGADAAVAGLLGEGLRAIDARAQMVATTRFDLLSVEQQTEVLGHVETTDMPARFFPTLRDLVYEAYYTQPRIQKLLGYNFRSGRRRTAPPSSFDEQRLARVRTMAPLYRQVTS